MSLGKVNNALGFRGDTHQDYVSIPDDSSLYFSNKLTLEAWVYFNDITTNDIVIYKYKEYTLKIANSADRLQAGFYRAGVWRTGDSDKDPISEGAWYHIVATIDTSIEPEEIIFYSNGVKVGNVSGFDGTGNLNDDDTEPLIIGCNNDGVQCSDAYFDEVALYDRVLTALEVEAHYNNSLNNRSYCENDAVCGNGVKEGSEECDDGNTQNEDGCSSTCTLENDYCGNSICDGNESYAECAVDCNVNYTILYLYDTSERSIDYIYNSSSTTGPIEINLSGANLSITWINITPNAVQYGVNISIRALDSSSNALSTSEVYQYIQITTNATFDDNPQIEFKTTHGWISSTNQTNSTIKLQRYSGGSWSELTTDYKSKDSAYHYFSTSTPGFSDFAVSSSTSTEEEENTGSTGSGSSGGSSTAGQEIVVEEPVVYPPIESTLVEDPDRYKSKEEEIESEGTLITAAATKIEPRIIDYSDVFSVTITGIFVVLCSFAIFLYIKSRKFRRKVRKEIHKEERYILSLIKYIRHCLKKGYHPIMIKQHLIRAGWKPEVVDKHIDKVLKIKKHKKHKKR